MKQVPQPILFLLCTLILCAIAGPSQAEVFRWKDNNGQIVFGDSPPKNKTATAVSIDNTENSGAQFATPGQVKDIEQNAQSRHRQNRASTHIDSRCRSYVSQLNKIEIFLQHTPTDLDKQKARDLRKLIKIECGNEVLTLKHDDWQCKRYRTDLNKAEIYLEHTFTERDEQKVKDLKKQIASECQ